MKTYRVLFIIGIWLGVLLLASGAGVLALTDTPAPAAQPPGHPFSCDFSSRPKTV